MTNRELLKQVYNIDKLIDAKIKELNKLKSLKGLRAVRYNKVQVMSSNVADDTVLIDDIVDLENDINESIDTLVSLKKQANIVIDRLNDNRFKLILIKRYLNNETFEKIAVDMNLSWKWTHTLHKEALEALEEVEKLN